MSRKLSSVVDYVGNSYFEWGRFSFTQEGVGNKKFFKTFPSNEFSIFADQISFQIIILVDLDKLAVENLKKNIKIPQNH